MSQRELYRKIPQKHSCGTTLEEKTIPVNRKVIGWENGYPVSYCSNCKIYKLNKYESEDPEIIGDIITEAQAQQNLRTHNSIYQRSYLEEMAKKLSQKNK